MTTIDNETAILLALFDVIIATIFFLTGYVYGSLKSKWNSTRKHLPEVGEPLLLSDGYFVCTGTMTHNSGGLLMFRITHGKGYLYYEKKHFKKWQYLPKA